MILRRLGNKKKIAHEIKQYFPAHKIYIEPFFGSGGMYFNKPKAKYNILNDLDSDVFNLFQVVMNQKEELEAAFKIMPIHKDLLEYWKKNFEVDPVKKALRFLFLSNLTYLGKHDTLRYGARNDKNTLYNNIERTFEMLKDVQFNNCDFRALFKGINYMDGEEINSFAYLDPPYVGTGNNYQHSFTEQDSIDLLDTVTEAGIKWAMSEFDNEFILDQIEDRKLNLHIIGERQNLKNRRTEILITNYTIQQMELF